MKNFEAPRKSLGDQKADVIAKIIASSGDIALVLDRKGVIRDVMCMADDVSAVGCHDWVGQPWTETVTVESRPKIDELISSATDGELAGRRWRQVNHHTARGADVPIRYSVTPLGTGGRLIAIGHDLRAQAEMQQRLIEAQASMEREYVRLRQIETRYRALFQVTSEAVIILNANTLRVTEANPAASHLLVNGSNRTVGRSFVELFAEESRSRALDLLNAAQTQPRAEGVQVTTAHGGRSYLLSASLFRQDGTAHYLIRLIPMTSDTQAASLSQKSHTLSIIEALPDGFVVADKEKRIVSANKAFLEMCELAGEGQAKGEPLDKWLGRIEVDIDVLAAHVRENGSIRRFSTVVRGEFGGRQDVEISAVYVPDSSTPYYGFSIRKIEPLGEGLTETPGQLPQSVEQLTSLVGRVPLKDLVRETTDIVERLCIEAALELTRDNRASAAEMLGLSRQSFYVKMRRYGLGELDADDAS